MTLSTFNYRKPLVLLCAILIASNTFAGTPDSLVTVNNKDTLLIEQPTTQTSSQLNMDAINNRPFLLSKNTPVAVGGYLEANSIYGSDDGVTEGLSFQARRLTVFLSAPISNRIKFMSEIEYEDGTKEIAIEFAAMDISFAPSLNLRGGIVTNPIGSFNQNHDGPKWEFIERPSSASNLLPATFSNAGFGLFGKFYKKNWVFGYEAYLTNGFDASIIDNDQNRTYLPAAKENPERFEESSNGVPLFTGKIALKNRKIAELGFSYMQGVYNQFELDGIVIADKQYLKVYAVDFNTTIRATKTKIIAEAVYIKVDVPRSYGQQYGNKQTGMFVDVVQPVFTKSFFNWKNATINVAARLDYVDWNIGTFDETGAVIGDEMWAITPAVSFRPNKQTVVRLNYRYQLSEDILNNPSVKAQSWLFGFSTYF